MCLDELPDLILLNLFSNCNFEDIESIQRTSKRLYNHVTDYRLYYSKEEIARLHIEVKQDGQREIKTVSMDEKTFKKTTKTGLLKNVIGHLNPRRVISNDHDELANMSHLWWEDRRDIMLSDIIDYRRYLRHLDKCRQILLSSNLPNKLSEILQFMETKHLKTFRLRGDGEIECTLDDLKKIARLSNKMVEFSLTNLSQSSKISNDDFLDVIELGSFSHAYILIPRIHKFENIEEHLRKRNWVVGYKRKERTLIEVEIAGDVTLLIRTKYTD